MGVGVGVGVALAVGVPDEVGSVLGVPLPRVSRMMSTMSTAISSAPPIEARMMRRRRDLRSSTTSSGTVGVGAASFSVGASPAASNRWVGVSSLMS
ncbi:MAG: hypothetical protein KKH51_11540 [Actinobacteria bacterium]|nr:hypothetical protein [Actinomycetota bacterium]